jgi:hypothetical protein
MGSAITLLPQPLFQGRAAPSVSESVGELRRGAPCSPRHETHVRFALPRPYAPDTECNANVMRVYSVACLFLRLQRLILRATFSGAIN